MTARIKTVAFQGIKAIDIDVQVQATAGLPSFQIVGLPDKAVAESRERVRAALQSMGLALPTKRITVNLSPADILKEGSHYDLPLALGLLIAMEVLPSQELEGYFALGELALDGEIRPVSGVLPAAIQALASDKDLICPESCGPEAAWATGLGILAPSSLLALVNHFKGTQVLSPPTPKAQAFADSALDLVEVKGQESGKRALEIAAAGGHNLLMQGPPGSGKSMLAARLGGLLPPLDPEESLEVTMIHSIMGHLPEGGLVRQRPFRDPHHSASLPALIGGGMRARPGEISLAHQGVLFLDELPEFSRSTLEALRQPLETGRVIVSRVNAQASYPARFQLVAAMNPCRCGYLGDAARACSRAPKCGTDYQAKISGPILDRIDLHTFVPNLSAADLTAPATGEKTEQIRARVLKARSLQKERFKALQGHHNNHEGGGPHKSPPMVNAQASGQVLEAMTSLETSSRALLQKAADQMALSARGYHRVLRVARTLADLEEGESIRSVHIAEALSFRPTL